MNVVSTFMSGFKRAYDYIVTEPLEDKKQRKAFQASVMEEIDIIKRELVMLSADKMEFQQEAFDSLVKTEKATSIMNVELKKSIAISAELNNVIVRIDGTVTSEKVMVAETNSRVKNIQKNLSKVVDKGPVKEGDLKQTSSSLSSSQLPIATDTVNWAFRSVEEFIHYYSSIGCTTTQQWLALTWGHSCHPFQMHHADYAFMREIFRSLECKQVQLFEHKKNKTPTTAFSDFLGWMYKDYMKNVTEDPQGTVSSIICANKYRESLLQRYPTMDDTMQGYLVSMTKGKKKLHQTADKFSQCIADSLTAIIVFPEIPLDLF